MLRIWQTFFHRLPFFISPSVPQYQSTFPAFCILFFFCKIIRSQNIPRFTNRYVSRKASVSNIACLSFFYYSRQIFSALIKKKKKENPAFLACCLYIPPLSQPTHSQERKGEGERMGQGGGRRGRVNGGGGGGQTQLSPKN